jgi:hypothetical protein
MAGHDVRMTETTINAYVLVYWCGYCLLVFSKHELDFCLCRLFCDSYYETTHLLYIPTSEYGDNALKWPNTGPSQFTTLPLATTRPHYTHSREPLTF